MPCTTGDIQLTGMVQFAKSQGNTFSVDQKARSHEAVGFGLVMLCQKCNPRLNHANGADVTAGYIMANVERLREPMQKITDYVLKSACLKETAEVIQLKQARG